MYIFLIRANQIHVLLIVEFFSIYSSIKKNVEAKIKRSTMIKLQTIVHKFGRITVVRAFLGKRSTNLYIIENFQCWGSDVKSAICMIYLEYFMFDEEVAYNMNFTVAILEKESEIEALWVITTCR